MGLKFGSASENNEQCTVLCTSSLLFSAMVKAMKAMKAMKSMKSMKAAVKAMPKTGIAEALAAKTGLEKKDVLTCLEGLETLATTEVKKTGKFTIPGLCMLKTRIRPARKAGKSMAFGKTIKVKARKAKKIVKAFCVKALKDAI